jgi:hypothetical protein
MVKMQVLVLIRYRDRMSRRSIHTLYDTNFDLRRHLRLLFDCSDTSLFRLSHLVFLHMLYATEQVVFGVYMLVIPSFSLLGDKQDTS